MDEACASTTDPRPGDRLERNRDFVLLFAAQIVSLLGSGVTTVALALFSYKLTGGKDATVVVGNALMLRILAFLIFSQPAGVLADRVSRKQLLIVMDLGRFALLALFPLVTEVWQIYLLIFAINALTAGFTPTYEATIPQVVGADSYPRALVLSRVALDVEAVLGPMFAGILVASFGVRWVFWFDGLTYLISAAFIFAAAIPRLPAKEPGSHPSFLSDVLHGSRLLFREPALRQALIASIAEATAGAAAIVVTVTYVRDTLQLGDFAVAGMMAAVGVGSSVAALTIGQLMRRWERSASSPDELHQRRHRLGARMLLGGDLVLSAILLAGGLKPPWWLFGLLWMANGVGQALIALPSAILLAEHTDDRERGRAYAAHFALTHACWLVTYPAVGYSATFWGAPATFAVAGMICLLTTLVAALAGAGPDVPHTHSDKLAND
jgi:MFS transporter, NRE family, putaive nickel resistance protein